MSNNKLTLPFEKKNEEQAARRNLIYRTAYYDLLAIEDRARLQTDLNVIVNDYTKRAILEFNVENKADGTPFVLARYRDDTDLQPRNLNWFDINIRMYGSYQLEAMDEIINSHDSRTVRLLGEKRFTYKTGEVCILLIWAEIRSTARSQEALDGIRATLIGRH